MGLIKQILGSVFAGAITFFALESYTRGHPILSIIFFAFVFLIVANLNEDEIDWVKKQINKLRKR